MPEQDYRVYLAGLAFDPLSEPPAPPPDRDSYYVVQFFGPLTREQQQHLRTTYGLSLSDYVPNLAYLERLSPQKLSELSRDRLYRAHLPYETKYKISPSIEEDAWRENDAVEPRLRLVLFPEADVDEIVSAINLAWATQFRTKAGDAGEGMSEPKRREDDDLFKLFDDRPLGGQRQLIFFLPSAEPLVQVASLEGVRWVEEAKPPDRDARLASPGAVTSGVIQSGTRGQTPIWEQGIAGLDQVIGVTDGRPDLEHCHLRDPENDLPGAAHRKVQGSRHSDGAKLSDHGMAVVSIAAGTKFDTPAKDDLNKGVAYEARLSLDNDEDVDNQQTMMAVLDNQRLDGARTHSNSWHINDPSYNQIDYAVDQFVWLNEQHLVCSSSGNKKEKPGAPATAKNALSVSASGNAGREMEFRDGVSTPPADGRRKPEICAPGCGIKAANVTDGKCSAPTKSCAASWAAPVIAGAAALVRQYYLEGWYPTGRRTKADGRDFVSAALVKATLLNSTVDMTKVAGYPSAKEGWGLVKLDNSLFFAGGPRKLFVDDVPNASGLHTRDSKTYEVKIQDSGQALKITLCWSDPPPGVFGTGPALVNDLDLIAEAPDGQIFFGNNIDTATGFSNPGVAPPDNRNNVEMVIIDRPTPGAWKITVRSAAANVGQTGQGQGFALVVTASLP